MATETLTRVADERALDEAAAEKSLDDWLTLTSSRTAKWWYSTLHNVTAMVGAGVLSLPFALAQLGWGPGVTVLVLSWAITFYTIWQMIEMHETVPGKRFDRYYELGQYVFGEKLGLYVVVPQQIAVNVGTNIVYMVTGGQCLMKFYSVVCPSCTPLKTPYWILIFASCHFVISHLPNLNSISGVSLAAATMSLVYSSIAWIASVVKGVSPNVSYGHVRSTPAGNAFGALTALGDIAFAYAGHTVVMEIQASLPSTPEKPSKGPMWRGAALAYIVVGLCYFPAAIIGYYVFGSSVKDNVLLSLEKPVWLIAAANLFVVIHVIGGYQVYAMPMFDMLESLLVKRMKFKPSAVLRFSARTLYVALTTLIAICLPFFGGLLGFFGGLFFAPASYFIPCMCWLKLKKPKPFSITSIINWFCIVAGVSLMTLGPIGGLRTLIVSAKTYKFFS